MKLENIPPGIIDWPRIAATTQPGAAGSAKVRAQEFGDVQVRMVDYSAGYVADHWCHKGHIVFVAAGQLTIEHQGGPAFELTAGMSYRVADGVDPPHRVLSRTGASVLIVD